MEEGAMASMVIWVVGMAIALSGLLLAAAANAHGLHVLLAALVSVFVALSAIKEHRAAQRNGASEATLAAIAARYIGLLWCWSAVTVCATYLLVLQWAAWWGVFMLLTLGTVLAMFISFILRREAEGVTVDSTMMTIVRVLYKVQFAWTCVALGAAFSTGKFGIGGLAAATGWAGVSVTAAAALGVAMVAGHVIMHELTVAQESDARA
jgi:hypothetical protein